MANKYVCVCMYVCVSAQMCMGGSFGCSKNKNKNPSIQCENNMSSSARISQVLGFGDEAISKTP